jgi:hypothetical protein
MPTVKSFTGFAGTPGIGSAFIGAANNMASIISAAREAANQLQLGREKIQADMAQASMAASARSQALQSQALRDEQELRVKEQYQQAQLGLKRRELDQAEQIVGLKTQEAAQQFQAQQGFEKEMASLTSGGMDINEAFQNAARKFGPQMGGIPAAAYGEMLQPGGQAAGADYGSLQKVIGPDGSPIKDYAWGQTGPRSRQLIQLPKSMEEDTQVKPIEGMPGFVERGNKVYRLDEPQEVKDLRKKRDRLELAHEKDEKGALAYQTPDKELKGGQKQFKAAYVQRMKQITETQDKIAAMTATKPTSDPAPKLQDYEGKPVRDKRTGQLGRIINGEFVPDEEQ